MRGRAREQRYWGLAVWGREVAGHSGQTGVPAPGTTRVCLLSQLLPAPAPSHSCEREVTGSVMAFVYCS